MELSKSQLYKLYSSIAYGYIIKNYTKSFQERVKGNIKVLFISNKKGVVKTHCWQTGESFLLTIHPFKNKIEHTGCYALNKGFNNEELIKYNLKRISS